MLKHSALYFLQDQWRWLASTRSDDATPTTTIAGLRNSAAGRLQWTSALLPQVLADARQHMATEVTHAQDSLPHDTPHTERCLRRYRASVG